MVCVTCIDQITEIILNEGSAGKDASDDHGLSLADISVIPRKYAFLVQYFQAGVI